MLCLHIEGRTSLYLSHEILRRYKNTQNNIRYKKRMKEKNFEVVKYEIVVIRSYKMRNKNVFRISNYEISNK